ncbi:MAG: UDP-N-acetylglucosamine 2-epimerase (non-hydrolyzing) [Planctomycetaceae bacterium]|nr:UDP-N-acetylglucosamine 2-epimerase (non-hydrolyzing) [Planctomycetaceae bacterium]
MSQARKILTVVGARPQFVKAAAVSRAIAAHNAEHGGAVLQERIVHTGQHYDDNMSKVFFDELQIPQPAMNLGVGSGSHGAQTAVMLDRLEQVILSEKPDWVLIYGDTNSTLAAALAAVKIHVPIAHVEAGLRSFNRRMPEEINRVVADHLSSALFCPTDAAVSHLAAEGIVKGVHKTGDVMYDSVLFNAELGRKSDILARLGLEPKSFYLATVHRAENTDDPARLNGILRAFAQLDKPVIFPVHPRTRQKLAGEQLACGVRLIDPVPYLDMLMLEAAARMIMTDSGGVQKEAFWFDVPCVTLRDETEWSELVEARCNVLAGASEEAILKAVASFESRGAELPQDRPADLYGDGRSSGRIVSILAGGPANA